MRALPLRTIHPCVALFICFLLSGTGFCLANSTNEFGQEFEEEALWEAMPAAPDITGNPEEYELIPGDEELPLPPPPIEPEPVPEIAEFITDELKDVAQALQNDPHRIYDFVYNHIEYVHYFGSKKGAQLTLLERSGNDFDQCALLVAILRAAKMNSGATWDVFYEFGAMKMPYQSSTGPCLTNWLGIRLEKTSANYNTVASLLNNLNEQRGYPRFTVGGTYFQQPLGDTENFVFQRVWVKLVDGENTYFLDPALKLHRFGSAKSLDSAMGLNLNSVIAGLKQSANIPTSGEFVANLNYSQLSSTLGNYTFTLLNSFSGQGLANLSVDELLGRDRVEPRRTLALPTALAFPIVTSFKNNGNKNVSLPRQQWPVIPSSYFVRLNLTFDGVTVPLRVPELRARRLAITFGGSGQVRILLDDELIKEGPAKETSSVKITIKIDHPFGDWDTTNRKVKTGDRADQPISQSFQRAAHGYAIIYGFDDPKERLQRDQERLQSLIREKGETSVEALTQCLQIMGLSWIQQTDLAAKTVATPAELLWNCHHRIGRAGYEKNEKLGYYVDMPLNKVSYVWKRGTASDPANPGLRAFDVLTYFWSALEHSVIEQWQKNPSASTVKCLYVANANGRKIFRIDSGNWTSVHSQLITEPTTLRYTETQTNWIKTQVNGGKVLLMPSIGRNPVGNHWKGYGYLSRLAGGSVATMGISGGYAGGFSGNQINLNPSVFSSEYELGSTFAGRVPVTVMTPVAGDPVDMATGAFLLESTDLATGGTDPWGLTFARSYNSARRYVEEPLAKMGHGWVHRYIIKASVRSDAGAALGMNTPHEMASYLVAARVAYELFGVTPSASNPEAFLWTSAALTAQWGVDQLADNAVNVMMGSKTVQFIRQPTGLNTFKYIPGAGLTITLEKSGGNFVMRERHGNIYNFDGYNRLSTIVDPYGKSMVFDYDNGRINHVTDRFGRRFKFEYNNNRLWKVQDIFGGTVQRSVTFTYDSGNLETVTDPEGKAVTYGYDEDRRMIWNKDGLARKVIENFYDDSGRVYKQWSQGLESRTWKFYYSGFENVEEDPMGGRTVYYYDDKSRAVGVEDGLGNRSHFSYDGQNHTVRTLTPKGEITEREYDADHNMIRITEAVGVVGEERTSSRYYDAQKRLERIRDFRGQDTIYTYNTKHQVTSVTSPNVNNTLPDIVQFGYYADDTATGRAGNLEWQKDQEDFRTDFQYDTKGHLTRRTVPDDGNPSTLNFEVFVNNYRGDIIAKTDFRNKTTAFEYNNRRQLKKQIAPGNIVTEMVYDDAGKLWKTIDPKGQVTERTYSATDKPLLVKLPTVGGVIPEIENHYDSRDRLDWTENPLNQRTSFTYDAANRLTAVTDPLNRTTTSDYDPNGQKIAVTSSLEITPAQTTTFGFNARGENTSLTDAMNPGNVISYEYDANGNRTKVKNRNNGDFDSTFYNNNQLATFKTPLFGTTTTTTYEKRGMVSGVTEPSGQQTTYSYDNRGRLFRCVDGVTGGTPAIFTYDENGNLLTHTEGTKTITRVYDDLNRLTSYGYADSANTENNYNLGYQYDKNGNLTVLTYPGSLDTTAVGRFEAENAELSGLTIGSAQTSGDFTGTGYAIYPQATGGYVTWTANMTSGGFYDLSFRYKLGSGSRNMEVQVNGQVVSPTLNFPVTGSGSSWTYVTLPQQALQAGANTVQVKALNTGTAAMAMDHLSIAPVAQRNVYYTYDSHNRLTTVTDWANRVTSYTYDLAGRPTETLRPNGTKRKITYVNGETRLIEELMIGSGNFINFFKFDYDTGGRIKEEFIAPIPATVTQPPHTITHNAGNQISTFNGQTVTHDLDGNMTSGPLNSSTPVAHTYDTRNRLTAAGGVTYSYDQEGNRISRTQSGQTTRFVVNPASQLSQVLVRTRPDGSKTFYVHGAGLLYEVEINATGAESGTRRFYHYDYRGSTTALSDGLGSVVERIEYDVYGQVTRRVGSTVDTPFLYNGRYGVQTDPNGLLNMRARYYNAYIRRFLNADPAGFSGGLNFYAYADGNPVSLVDPFGLCSITENEIVKYLAQEIKIADQNAAQTEFYRKMDLAVHGITWDPTITQLPEPSSLAILSLAIPGPKFFRAAKTGPTVFRQGTFADEAIGWEGNYVKGKYWATDNPLTTPGYAKKYGLPAENTGKPDWVVGGKVQGNYTTRPAPPSHNNPINTGGATEVLDPENVQLDWFHMPD